MREAMARRTQAHGVWDHNLFLCLGRINMGIVTRHLHSYTHPPQQHVFKPTQLSSLS